LLLAFCCLSILNANFVIDICTPQPNFYCKYSCRKHILGKKMNLKQSYFPEISYIAFILMLVFIRFVIPEFKKRTPSMQACVHFLNNIHSVAKIKSSCIADFYFLNKLKLLFFQYEFSGNCCYCAVDLVTGIIN
jgi:hypothetical protein